MLPHPSGARNGANCRGVPPWAPLDTATGGAHGGTPLQLSPVALSFLLSENGKFTKLPTTK